MSRPTANSRLARMAATARISLLACVGTALLAAGCGSDPEPTIPTANGDEMLTALAGVDQAVAVGSCPLALEHAADFKDEVVLLPAAVDDAVKQGLFDVADELPRLISDAPECERTGATGPSGAVEQPDETTTSTTSTTPTTTTTTTEAEPPETPEPPAGGGGGGQEPGQPQVPAPPSGGDGGSTGGTSPSGGIGEKRAGR